MKININTLEKELDEMIQNPRCELNYNYGYELVISVVLSAQCTDKRVNEITKILYNKYSLKELGEISEKEIAKIIYPLGNYTKKSHYVKEIATRLYNDFNGEVPNNREYLESLPGVGRKSSNVILSELFNVPTFAIDTHVDRVSKRLGLAKNDDSLLTIEKKLMKLFNEEDINRRNHQILLLGRYICTSQNPNCSKCLISNCPSRKKQ